MTDFRPLASPWIPFLALDYLNSIIRSGMTVFEYGSGGSTLYFSERIYRFASVEHSPEWYDKMRELINSAVNYRLIEPDPAAVGDDKSNPAHYTSSPLSANFRAYVSAIDNYNDCDIVFIDGRSRAACLAHATPKIKPGGWIILDNSERDYYLQNTRHLFDDWETVEIFGYGPYLSWPWKTLFMRKL